MDVQRVGQYRGRLLCRIVVRKRLEIVEADETLRGSGHPFDIEIVFDPPDERLGEGGATAADVIQIAAANSIMSCMKAMAHRLGAEDDDVRRKRVIDTAPQRLGWRWRVDEIGRAACGGCGWHVQ